MKNGTFHESGVSTCEDYPAIYAKRFKKELREEFQEESRERFREMFHGYI